MSVNKEKGKSILSAEKDEKSFSLNAPAHVDVVGNNEEGKSIPSATKDDAGETNGISNSIPGDNDSHHSFLVSTIFKIQIREILL